MNYFKLVLFALIGIAPVHAFGQNERPNIVWLVTEDNSKHFLRLYDSSGVAMPNIEALAQHGIVFNHAFSNAPVCSVARSTIISGCYAPRIGAQYHRRVQKVELPEGLRMFPSYLREAGYYTTNNSKEDYNIIKDDDVWHESSNKASYKNRKENQPFFHVQNYGITHEGQLHFRQEQMENQRTIHDPADIVPFPYHPNTPTFRYTYARLLDHHRIADSLMGEFIKGLKSEGLLENTIIFYYGDHGGVLPRSKGYLYESGLHVPMVVYVPDKWKHVAPVPIGSRSNAFVSFVDLAPTVLNIAGISVPEQMDGTPFLGKGVNRSAWEARNTTFSYADRFDEKYEKVRAIRKGNYKYIRNYQPFYPDALYNFYRYRMLAFSEWKTLYLGDELNEDQIQFFQPKTAESLYDLSNDPHETKNLAQDASLKAVLLELRSLLQTRVKSLPDLSFYPEPYFLNAALPAATNYGKSHQRQIEQLVAVADLALLPYSAAKEKLKEAVEASDPWERYWAFTVCSYFGEEATSLHKSALLASQVDAEILVRFRAAEFLALTDHAEGMNQMQQCLAQARSMIEANLMLNAFANLKELGHSLPEGLGDQVKESWRGGKSKSLVEHRLEYLIQQ
ncbi:MAG: sulfatase [Saprospiraceae bacterium]|nr:sulfatase [Saprospiraceae bacterium]